MIDTMHNLVHPLEKLANAYDCQGYLMHWYVDEQTLAVSDRLQE